MTPLSNQGSRQQPGSRSAAADRHESTDDYDRRVIEGGHVTHPYYIGVAFAGSDKPRRCSHRHRSQRTALLCVERREAAQIRLWVEDRAAAGFA